MKFAANLTPLFTEYPFPERFAAAARAGFRGCEFRSPYEYRAQEVAQWLADSGLENVLFNMPWGDWAAGDRGLVSIPGREAEFRDGVFRSLEYATVLGTPQLQIMSGAPSADLSRERCREVMIGNLTFAAAEAAKHGRGLLIEPKNTKDMPGYFLNTQAAAHLICQQVGAGNLKVQMDFYHVQVVEGGITAKLQRYLSNIAHVQVAGVPNRDEPDNGELDYRYVFGLLEKLGYPGWIGCEYTPRGRTEDGLGWLKAYT